MTSAQERAIIKEIVEELTREFSSSCKPKAPTEADDEKAREVFTRLTFRRLKRQFGVNFPDHFTS